MSSSHRTPYPPITKSCPAAKTEEWLLRGQGGKNVGCSLHVLVSVQRMWRSLNRDVPVMKNEEKTKGEERVRRLLDTR